MKRIVLRFGLASGVILVALSSVLWAVTMNEAIDLEGSEVIGYSAMVLSFLLVFFGVRSYRDTVAGGAIGFGKAFQVGLLITLITCAMYVITWEIAYFNFFPDFLDEYTTRALAKMRAEGESAAAIQKMERQMAFMAKYYDNIFFNSAITLLEVLPVGLIVSLISAAILRRKPADGAPAAVAIA